MPATRTTCPRCLSAECRRATTMEPCGSFAIGDRVVMRTPRYQAGTVQAAKPGQPVHVLWDYQSIYSPADTCDPATIRHHR